MYCIYNIQDTCRTSRLVFIYVDVITTSPPLFSTNLQRNLLFKKKMILYKKNNFFSCTLFFWYTYCCNIYYELGDTREYISLIYSRHSYEFCISWESFIQPLSSRHVQPGKPQDWQHTRTFSGLGKHTLKGIVQRILRGVNNKLK
jgi:hypothetical protein